MSRVTTRVFLNRRFVLVKRTFFRREQLNLEIRNIRRFALCFLALTIVGIVFGLPDAQAAGGNKYYLENTTIGSCATLCKNLATASGSTLTDTVQNSIAIGSAP